MSNLSAVKQWKQRVAQKSRVTPSINHSLAQMIDTEEIAFSLWLQNETKFETPADLLLPGIAAFALTGKLMTVAELWTIFPSNEAGMSALALFIWDVTRNECKATMRLRDELASE